MDKTQIKELRENLRNTRSTIWHGVISFTEEFGDTYCNSTERAIELMKTEFPKFFEKSGLNPDNIEWFAGLHENTDNKHIHFSFFEKAPLRKKQNHKGLCFSDGYIPITSINSFKTRCELRLLNIYKEIAHTRKGLTKTMREILDTGDYMKKVKSLIFILPETGRMSYDSENMKAYRPQIDLVVNAIIGTNKDLQKKFENFDKIISKRDNELIKAYSKLKLNYTDKLLHDKCIYDIYKRLGNLVLHTVKQIRIEEKMIEHKTRNRLIKKRIDKMKRKALIKQCMRLSEYVNHEIISAFQEYLDKLEEARFIRMKEEGYFD